MSIQDDDRFQPKLGPPRSRGGGKSDRYIPRVLKAATKVTLASGRFALLDDDMGFSLVPWRPVIEQHLGREIRGTVSGADTSWDFSRSRSLGR